MSEINHELHIEAIHRSASTYNAQRTRTTATMKHSRSIPPSTTGRLDECTLEKEIASAHTIQADYVFTLLVSSLFV